MKCNDDAYVYTLSSIYSLTNGKEFLTTTADMVRPVAYDDGIAIVCGTSITKIDRDMNQVVGQVFTPPENETIVAAGATRNVLFVLTTNGRVYRYSNDGTGTCTPRRMDFNNRAVQDMVVTDELLCIRFRDQSGTVYYYSET